MYSIEKPLPPRPGRPPTPAVFKKVATRKPQVAFPQWGKMQGFPRDGSILGPKEAFAKYFSFLQNVQWKEFVRIKILWSELHPLLSWSQRKLAEGLVLPHRAGRRETGFLQRFSFRTEASTVCHPDLRPLGRCPCCCLFTGPCSDVGFLRREDCGDRGDRGDREEQCCTRRRYPPTCQAPSSAGHFSNRSHWVYSEVRNRLEVM